MCSAVVRITSNVALSPMWVYNVPSEHGNKIEKSDEGDCKKIKEKTKKRLADHECKD